MHNVEWLVLGDAGQTKVDSLSQEPVCSQCGHNHCSSMPAPTGETEAQSTG